MINVLFYALPNINSGGYSVVLNLYEDIKKNKDSYQDIHWYLITGMDGFENTDNITVLNESWALKTYFHRCYFNNIRVKEIVKKYDIKAVLSLNMGIHNLNIPSIISLHNVLPLYHCGKNVFDSFKDVIKQAIINKLIVNSLKQAAYVVVPSYWIKNRLEQQLNIYSEKLIVSPIATPEMNSYVEITDNKRDEKCCEFIYPASGFPYKNHHIITEATKLLYMHGVKKFYVRFAGNVGNGKTIQRIKKEVQDYGLPIEFSGLLSKQELIYAYKYGTLIFPSRIETDGFPLLESMACGGYIIAANLDYAKEALAGYDKYDLFDPDDAETLAGLMENVINGNLDRNCTGGHFFKRDVPRSRVIVPLIRAVVNH